MKNVQSRCVWIDQRRYETSDRTDSHWTHFRSASGGCHFLFVLVAGLVSPMSWKICLLLLSAKVPKRQLAGVGQMPSTVIQFPPIFLLLLDLIPLSSFRVRQIVLPRAAAFVSRCVHLGGRGWGADKMQVVSQVSVYHKVRGLGTTGDSR